MAQATIKTITGSWQAVLSGSDATSCGFQHRGGPDVEVRSDTAEPAAGVAGYIYSSTRVGELVGALTRFGEDATPTQLYMRTIGAAASQSALVMVMDNAS